jgi:serine/threonine protein kinase
MKQLRQYEMLREIGRGGMASVHEAMHVELGRRVAIKTILPEVAKDERSVARFVREAKAACIVRHPHVVEIFDFGTVEGIPFLVMELLEGETLRALLVREKALAVEAAIALLLPVAAAVAHAHRLGIVHRDLKPANVFLTQGIGNRPWAKVLDFGISKRLDSALHTSWREGITSAESMVGTLAYMAPELVQDASSASAASDQYALGVVLYESLTGRLPFFGPSPYQLMHNVLHAPVPAPSALQTSLPQELDAIVLRALERNPDRRYPSVQALATQLLAFAGRDVCIVWKSILASESAIERTIDAHADADAQRVWTRPTARKPRARFLWLQVAALVAALAAGIGLFRRASTPSKHASVSAAPPPSAHEPASASDPVNSIAAANDVSGTLVELPVPSSGEAAPQPIDARTGANALVPTTAKNAAPKQALRAPAASSATPAPAAKPNGVTAGTNEAPIFE